MFLPLEQLLQQVQTQAHILTQQNIWAKKTSGGMCENITQCTQTNTGVGCDVTIVGSFYGLSSCSAPQVTAYLIP